MDFSRNLPTEIRPGLKFRVLKRLAHRWIGNDRHRNTNKNSRKKKIPLLGFFCAQELLMLFWLDLDCVDPICLAYIIVDQMKYFLEDQVLYIANEFTETNIFSKQVALLVQKIKEYFKIIDIA